MQTKWSAHHAHSGTPVAGRQRYGVFVLWLKVGRGKDGERFGGRTSWRWTWRNRKAKHGPQGRLPKIVKSITTNLLAAWTVSSTQNRCRLEKASQGTLNLFFATTDNNQPARPLH